MRKVLLDAGTVISIIFLKIKLDIEFYHNKLKTKNNSHGRGNFQNQRQG